MSPPTTLASILSTLSDEANPDACRAMSEQYGIHAERSYGVPMRRLLEIAKTAAPNHGLALELWDEGSYEARTIAALVDDPSQTSHEQMQQWCEQFDNWAIVDTACFRLFDRTPDPWPMVEAWTADERLFVRRAGFALVWGLALHAPDAPDEHFRNALDHAEARSGDTRPLVGKAITMALRAIGTKRTLLRAEVVDLARRLAEGDAAAARRVGRPILRSFT